MSRVLPLLVLVVVGCGPSPDPVPPPPTAPSPADGLARGAAFLVGQQSPDGRWRSDVYATFRDGTALTPLVVVALQDAAAADDARRKGAAAMAALARPDGTIDPGPDGLPYPVYTAALSVIALSHPENAEHAAARDAWLAYLLDRQLTEANGWRPDDKEYGGWGYYPGIPRKPTPGEAVPAQQLLESNLSATRFALEAITAARGSPVLAKRPLDVGAGSPAAGFVAGMRNPDDGFHFVADDPVRNKAGASAEAKRFHSYGSATADGLLCQLQPGFGRTGCNTCNITAVYQPRQKTADWLRGRFDPDRHPGDYLPAHEPNRNAVYFYYADAVARGFRRAGVTDAGGKPWAPALSAALLAKQRPDGSWSNPVELVRENDSVLATAYAVRALAACREPTGQK